MNFIIDSHCHLDLIEEKGGSIEEIMQNCINENVAILQTICTKITEFDKVYKYAEQYPNVFASIGIHPCNVASEPKIEVLNLLKICQTKSKIIGIGETGLDYYHDSSSKKEQIESFLKHIDLARKSNFPLIIHNRDSDSDMIKILEKEMKKEKFKALLHCFSSSKELAFKALDLGLYISISGIVTFKNATDLQEIVRQIPLNRILLETDSPYLAPTPYRGKLNQPHYVVKTANFVAEVKNISPIKLYSTTSQNFFDLFTNGINPLKK